MLSPPPDRGSSQRARRSRCGQRPDPVNVVSRRVRPWLSRNTLACTLRLMVLPSARVCRVSVTATALYGAPVTTLPGCISPKPRISIRAREAPPATLLSIASEEARLPVALARATPQHSPGALR